MMPWTDITQSSLDVIPFNISFMSDYVDKLGSQFSATGILGLLASLAVVTLGLVFMWWGVRKVIGAIMAAFRSGKFSV